MAMRAKTPRKNPSRMKGSRVGLFVTIAGAYLDSGRLTTPLYDRSLQAPTFVR